MIHPPVEDKQTKVNVVFRDFIIHLHFDGVLKTRSFNGGGLNLPHPPIFICENNRKSNKIMNCVDFFWRYGHFLLWVNITPTPIKTKLKYVKKCPYIKATTKKKNQLFSQKKCFFCLFF